MAELSGGSALDNALRDLARKLTTGQLELQVGFMSDATYPDGTPVAEIAAIQEFGAPAANIPPRPFFRNMIKEHEAEWGPTISKLLQRTNFDPRRTLSLLGEVIVGDLKQSITDTNAPPLAPATIRRKGFDKPLVDTAHMQNSVTYRVT